MAKNELDLGLIILVLGGLYLILNPGILQFGSTINVNVPQGSSGSSNTYTTTTNERTPTSLTVQLNTYDCNMGTLVVGSVTSDGYNYPVKIYVKHTGSGDQISEDGLLAADGRFIEGSNIQTPGVYEVWATSGGVSSNKVTLSVHGCRVVCDKTAVPFSPGSHVVNVKVYGDGNRAVVGMVNDPAHSISYPFPGVVNTNAGGYVSTSYDFINKAMGDYEVDAIVNGHQASSYGASWWVKVG